MARQVIVVAGMMIVRIDRSADGIDQGQVVSLLG